MSKNIRRLKGTLFFFHRTLITHTYHLYQYNINNKYNDIYNTIYNINNNYNDIYIYNTIYNINNKNNMY